MFSTNTYHALGIIAQLNQCFGKRTVDMEELMLHCLCSENELEYPLSKLEQHALVRQPYGAGKGYALAKSPEKIRLFDVIHLFESSLFTEHTDADNLLSCGEAKTLYYEYRPIQKLIVKKLKRKKLSEWNGQSSDCFVEFI